MDSNQKQLSRIMLYALAILLILIGVFKPNKSDAGEGLVARHGTIKVITGDLAGSRVGELYQTYLGIKTEIIPDTITVDFSNQLRQLWQQKADKSGMMDVAEDTRWQLIREYDQARTPTTLTAYRGGIDQTTKRLHQSLDWPLLCHDRKMETRTCQLTKQIAATISSRELLAIGFTEVMPGVGRINILVFDLALQKAGREYPESWPAIHDSRTSFGPWQPTEFAVYDTPDKIDGASIVNRYLPPSERIPGSVSMLRGDDHPKAAWLFAVRNLMRVIHRLDSHELATLESSWKQYDDEIVQLIALGHHAPAVVTKTTKDWLKNPENDFSESVELKRHQRYVTKTKENFKALAEL